MADLDELEIIKYAQQGDQDAFAKLFQIHYSFLYKYVLKMTLNQQTAEDLVQDTMLKGYDNIKKYNGQSKFSTWLITIATRLYLDQQRRKKREWFWQKNESEKLSRSLNWQLAYKGFEWSDIMEGFEKLKSDVRTAILLKHYYGYTNEEIGNMMGIREGTVKSRIHNGMKELRKELMQDG
ncbi:MULTISPECIES: RNA polymerase sigma factor SigY [unclassified Bacillus (in: firmicutes)]|uniref:RNA polymerase sigma factor SigY n=1 Tax=unclassified Bacillus (in: firmicutes) TaxID=185979 RepID=UPI00040AF699|nr:MULTISPECIES: RNA polymerase sigma factor SigY [unclassified Bacillus (in: firmicutes)]PGZ94228.1 RNA polymerase sigma factor SigY [Bacillus sp. AFS029533]SFD20238.1 RNA polymerase sigma-70 factor, ECF subfamily [Bacillus sp. UNCCL81]